MATTSAYSADPVFEANGKLISYLIQRIHDRELALPDFQRDFVWDAKATLELLRSIMSRFPAGTLLFWKQGDSTASFAARAVEGSPALGDKQPDELVLDGQQRLTALYRALTGQGDERFYAKLLEFTKEDGTVRQVHEVDFEKALFSFDLTGRQTLVSPEEKEFQYQNAVFPLAELGNFDEWLDEYARKAAADTSLEGTVKKQMRAVRDAFFVPLRSYGFPVVTLPSSTPLEAVCNIFETLNRTGKPLGAFDLVTARLYPKNVNLRDLWEDAQETFPVLKDFDMEPYSLLQAVSLRSRGSAQRSDVLTKLTADNVVEHWLPVVSGTAAVLEDLRSNYGVIEKRWLPYGMLLVPMAAVWPDLKTMAPIDKGHALERLSQYFWCTTFMTNFDQGANSQAGADYAKLSKWLSDGEQEAPESVKGFDLSESTLLRASVRRKALHAGVTALSVKFGAKDFYTAQKLSFGQERRVDSHHIFPKAYLNDPRKSELLLNRALIDSATNRVIGRSAPSTYLAKMRDAHGIEKLTDVLSSHAIATGETAGLDNDDYELFIKERLAAVVSLIEEATRKTVTKDAATTYFQGSQLSLWETA